MEIIGGGEDKEELDEVDLYGDLGSAGMNLQIQGLQDSLDERNEALAKITAENASLRSQVQQLVEANKQLESNIMKLYNTAVAEIDRKNAQLLEKDRVIAAFKATQP